MFVQIHDIQGKTYGRLTVIGRDGIDKHNRPLWRCRCECGGEKLSVSYDLRAGRIRSCGCLLKEDRHTRTLTHGRCQTAEYRSWIAMKERCSYPKHIHWKHYGGRGISVCERWLGSFESFLADMGEKPSPKHSIDRIDNDGNYEPSNCRWATQLQQANNTRKTKGAKA